MVSSILSGMMDVALRLPSPLVEIRDERVESRGVLLYLKRDDLIHAELSRNKWCKLKYSIPAAQEQGVVVSQMSAEVFDGRGVGTELLPLCARRVRQESCPGRGAQL